MWVVVLGCLLAGPPAPAPEPTTPPEQPASIRGGWIEISPLGGALPSPGGTDIARYRRAVRSGFRWGFGAGMSFEPAPHLFINASVGFEQDIWIFRNVEVDGYELCFAGDCYGWDERAVGHLMRIGPRLRLGHASRWVLAWALASGQLAISRVRLDCNNSVEDHCDRTETDLGPALVGGLGLAIRVTPRAAVGFEGSVQHSWLDRRDNPFRAIRSVDLGMLVALRF